MQNYIPIINIVSGYISEYISVPKMSGKYNIVLNEFQNITGSNTFGLSNINSNEQPTLVATGVEGGPYTAVCLLQYSVPHYYVPNTPFNIYIDAKTTPASAPLDTIDLTVFRGNNRKSIIGADLINTAPQAIINTWSTVAFSGIGTDVTQGDMLLLQLTWTSDNTSGGPGIIPTGEIGAVVVEMQVPDIV